MQEWYLGWEKVSCLERCPQFRSVLIDLSALFLCGTIMHRHTVHVLFSLLPSVRILEVWSMAFVMVTAHTTLR